MATVCDYVQNNKQNRSFLKECSDYIQVKMTPIVYMDLIHYNFLFMKTSVSIQKYTVGKYIFLAIKMLMGICTRSIYYTIMIPTHADIIIT